MVRNNGLSTWIGTADFFNTGISPGYSLDLLCNMGFHGVISCDIARISDAAAEGAAIVPIVYELAGRGGDVGVINLWGSAQGHAHREHSTSRFPLPGMQLSGAVTLVNNSSTGVIITNPASGTQFLVRTNGEVEVDRLAAHSFISLAPGSSTGWPAVPRFPGEVGWGARTGARSCSIPPTASAASPISGPGPITLARDHTGSTRAPCVFGRASRPNARVFAVAVFALRELRRPGSAWASVFSIHRTSATTGARWPSQSFRFPWPMKSCYIFHSAAFSSHFFRFPCPHSSVLLSVFQFSNFTLGLPAGTGNGLISSRKRLDFKQGYELVGRI